jgi:Putative beta barrel porin-7 (BBP7)
LLAALGLLLAGYGPALAEQSYNSNTGGRSAKDEFLGPAKVPDKAVALGDDNAQVGTFGLWGSAEHLLWWIKSDRVPPLVTAGGNGVLGAPGTRVLLDDLNFADDFRQGGRFTLGYHLESSPVIGIEASYFFLPDGETRASFSSNGNPVLGRPYIDVKTGMPAATLISSSGIAVGSVAVGVSTWLSGGETNISARLVSSDQFRLIALGGFRFLSLDDDLTIDQQFKVADSVPGFGGNRVTLQDEFCADNRFYGGQLGLKASAQRRFITIDFLGKIAMGEMRQVVNINGATNVLRPNGSTTVFKGGLLALRSNIGSHERNELAFVPEVGVNIGLQLTRRLKACVGYSFLWVSTVARAGEQIDPVVNVTQFPILSGNGPLVGPARPAIKFAETDFWAHGLNFGFELTY